MCHTTDAWKPADLDHDLTNFPLTGAHTAVTCASCHITNYTGTSSECLACHETDYSSVTDPNHIQSAFSVFCVECHTTSAWKPATIDHNSTGFPLTGAHEAVSCVDCHDAGYTNTTTLCYACHLSDYNGAIDPDHSGSHFSTNCGGCHTTEGWEPAAFDHNLSQFKLTGAHAVVGCNNCHTTGFTGTPTTCIACHQADYNAATDPDHVANALSNECTQCHSTAGWVPATLDHDLTGFPLTGAHVSVTCNSCHTSGYKGTPTDCYACHESEYTQTPDPNHNAAGFSTDCIECHSTSAWSPANLDHSVTGFPLSGAHLAVACNQCHASGYTGTNSECLGCHESDFSDADDPPHAGLPTNCTQCHTTSAWEPATFNHNQTRFELTGLHKPVMCANCHTAGYAGTPMECDACHHSDYMTTANPNHSTAGFSTDCALCHSPAGWVPATFDHGQTAFPLTGAHKTTACNSCHASGYSGTPTQCDACHHSDYTGVDNPNHVSAGFSTNCAQCHGTSSWSPSTWSHNQTGFTLTGAHRTVTCNNCHSVGFAGTASACYACHASDYTSVIDPNHVAGGFPTLCEQCHTTTAWTPSSFDHNLSGFPLTGAHTSVTCSSCHEGGYSGTPSACDACHHNDYAGVDDPNHVIAGFSTLCDQCHTTSGWTPAAFDHSLSGFPLTGAHVSVTCNSCHATGYTGTPSTCFACHSDDYSGVSDPNHTTAGFSTVCTQCHTTAAWTPASYDHNQSGFPLTGAHQAVTCNSCHAGGYTGTPSECFACHTDDYSAASPNHLAAGFPTTCQTCHSTTAWTPANWNHDAQYFPIYSGKHREKWDECLDCHINPSSFTAFECIYCHEHNQVRMDDKHKEEQGYQYLSTACLGCHPRGD